MVERGREEDQPEDWSVAVAVAVGVKELNQLAVGHRLQVVKAGKKGFEGIPEVVAFEVD